MDEYGVRYQCKFASHDLKPSVWPPTAVHANGGIQSSLSGSQYRYSAVRGEILDRASDGIQRGLDMDTFDLSRTSLEDASATPTGTSSGGGGGGGGGGHGGGGVRGSGGGGRLQDKRTDLEGSLSALGFGGANTTTTKTLKTTKTSKTSKTTKTTKERVIAKERRQLLSTAFADAGIVGLSSCSRGSSGLENSGDGGGARKGGREGGKSGAGRVARADRKGVREGKRVYRR